jgi:rare lipoprotein A
MQIPKLAVLWTLLGLAWVSYAFEAEASRHRASQAHAHARYLAARHHHGPRRAETARHIQRGIASVYADGFRGQKMADGTRFDPISNAAASKTLPLGTTAQVTNLENGRTVIVQVHDRGPHRKGRIIDVSPGSAATLGMDRHSTARVAVSPISPLSAR